MLRQLKRFLGMDRRVTAPKVPAVVETVAAGSSARDGAKALIAQGRLDEARDLLYEALRLKDDLAEVHYCFAVIHGLTEDLNELAAMMCALDLVISVDNTNVHQASRRAAFP